jgi:HD-GYP domain-containing protein (c-di-GMP phosphodiesterase class II)
VVDKATKLETIYDRIGVIDTRFEILKRDTEIEYLKALQQGKEDTQILDTAYRNRIKELEDDQAFLQIANKGGEFMDDDHKTRIYEIAENRWQNSDGEIVAFLSKDEVYNLCISKGTLTDEERTVINHHIVATIKMLESLPYPKHLQRVPEFAGGHHERMDGKGYPRGLTRDQMSVQARVMGIADIFEALTAKDRPYKKGMKLSLALTILGRMKLDNHIDPDLFDIFIREKVYMKYAEGFLDKAQIDEVDLSSIPGYTP